MKSSDRPSSFGQQAAEILARMTKEEFLAAIEERCPELIHGQGPKPKDAMVPGPRHDSGPSLQKVWDARRKGAKAKGQSGKAVAPEPAAGRTDLKSAATKAQPDVKAGTTKGTKVHVKSESAKPHE